MATDQDIVILAVDSSPFSTAAFDFYVENIHTETKSLVLLHCPEMTNLHTKAHTGHMPDYDKWTKLQEEENTTIEKLHQQYQQKLDDNKITGQWLVIHSNHAGETIVDTAKKHQATLVISGTRGLGIIRRTILGSVSDYLLHHSTCPVIIVRQ